MLPYSALLFKGFMMLEFNLALHCASIYLHNCGLDVAASAAVRGSDWSGVQYDAEGYPVGVVPYSNVASATYDAGAGRVSRTVEFFTSEAVGNTTYFLTDDALSDVLETAVLAVTYADTLSSVQRVLAKVMRDMQGH